MIVPATPSSPSAASCNQAQPPLTRHPVVRRLAAATLVSTYGNGLFTTVSALYFTRIIGLGVARVGLGLTIAGLFGVLASVRFGPVCDRFGSRPVLIVLLLGEALGTALTSAVDSFLMFVLLVSFTAICDRGASTGRAALYGEALPPQLRTTARAYLRAVSNVGIGAGAASAAIALHIDTRAAYVSVILVDAATFLVAAAVVTGLPTKPAEAGPRAPAGHTGRRRGRNAALRDGPYLLVTALNAVLSLQFSILEIGVPLWIVGHTQAPRVMVSATLLVNTALVVLFQVRAARGLTDVGSAARRVRHGALLLAAGWLLLAGCAGLPPWAATCLLLVALVVETAGEVLTSAAGWALSYQLADEARHGAYQGVFNGGWSVAAMLGPVIVTSIALRFGLAGWAVLAAAFAAAGAGLTPAARWAHRARLAAAARSQTLAAAG